MRTLQIANGYFGNKIYYNFFNILKEKNIDNVIFVPQKKNSEITNNKILLEKKVFAPNCFSGIDRLFFYRKEKKIFQTLISEYRDEIKTINIVHAHTLFSNGYIAYLMNKNFNIPYIVAVRNTDINIFFKYRRNLRNIGIEIMKNASEIVFLSNVSKKEVFCKYIDRKDEESLLNKTMVIPNGVNDFWIKNRVKSKKNVNKNEYRLIYVGEINRNKNVRATILACKKLIADNKHVRLTVVGKCANARFRRMLNEDFIEYNKYCTQEELINYYRNSDLFIMPSIKESFGVVYAEALTQGLPVIYTKGQGFDGQFQNGEVGFGVNCKDINEIKNMIMKIYDEYDSIQDRILKLNDSFNWDNISDEYIEIYGELLRRQ